MFMTFNGSDSRQGNKLNMEEKILCADYLKSSTPECNDLNKFENVEKLRKFEISFFVMSPNLLKHLFLTVTSNNLGVQANSCSKIGADFWVRERGCS